MEPNLEDLQGLVIIPVNKGKCRTFFANNFNWPWRPIEFLEMFLIAALATAHSGIFAGLTHMRLVNKDNRRGPLLDCLVILCPIAGVYAIVMLKLKPRLWISLIVITCFVIIPLIILGYLLGHGIFLSNIYLGIVCIFSPGAVVGLGIYKRVRNLVIARAGYAWGEAIIIAILVLMNVLFSLIIAEVTVDYDFASDPSIFLMYASGIYLALLVVLWIAIHMAVFKRQPNEIQMLKSQILAMENPSFAIQSILNKNPEVLHVQDSDFLSNYGHVLASASILLCVLGTEVGLISVVTQQKHGPYSNSAIYTSAFYIVAVPVFTYGGVVFSSSIVQKNDKYCVALMLFTTIPTIFIMWASYYLHTLSDFYYLGILIGVGFPGSILYWLSMSMIFDYNKRSYQYFSGICCLVAIVPLGLMWPLYSAGGMKETTFWVVLGVLFFGGLIVLVLWLVQFFYRLSKVMMQLLKEVYLFSGYDLSLYIYTACFVLGFSLLGWIIFRRLDYGYDWITGLIPGCFTIMGIVLIGTLIVHRLNLYANEVGVEEVTLHDIVVGTAPIITALQLKNQAKKKKFQGFIGLFGILITCAIAIPILSTSSSDFSVSTGVSIIIGVSIILLLILSLVELKSMLRQFGEIVISYTLSCCWLFLIIPVVCLIPVSLAASTTSTELHTITSWSIGSILLIFMIGVSVGSITLNLLFKRLEYEKIAKICCLHVKEVLTENGVRIKLSALRGIYDNFLNNGKDSVFNVLENATVYHYIDVNDNDPDLRYSKDVLTVREIAKMKLGKRVGIVDNLEEKSKHNGVSLIKYLRRLCISKDEDEVVKVAEKLNPEELVGIKEPESEDLGNKVMDMSDGVEQDWNEKFKETVKKNIKEKQNLAWTEIEKLDNSLIEDEPIKTERIVEVKLKPAEKEEIMSSKHLEMLCSSQQMKEKWLKACFARFSSGFIDEGGEPWMNLSDLRQFIRLTGMKPFISYAACDIIYVRLTRIYDPSTYTKTLIKLNFNQFSKTLLNQLGKLKYPSLSYKEAEEKLFKECLYPHLVTNLPYLYKYIPNESEQSINQDQDMSVLNLGKQSTQKVLESMESPNAVPEHPPSPSEAVSSNRRHSIRRTSTIYIKNRKSFFIPQIQRKMICSSCLDKFSSCTEKFFKSVISCCGKCFSLSLYCLMPTEKVEVEKIKKIIEEDIHERRSSPPWEEICHIIADSFKEVDDEARKKDSKQEAMMQMNLENIIGIVGHVSEVYSFMSVGFSKQVGWVYGSSFTNASSVVLADNEYWTETYWTCIGFCALFTILVFPAIKYIRQGRLGLNKDYTTASFPSFQSLLTKCISLTGKTLYLTILAALLSAFSCYYESTTDDWRLMRDSSVVCFSDQHDAYLVIAIAALVVYYPLATLLYPNIAYQDKALDIKFDTTYLVIESQGKVLIAAFSAFFAKEEYIWLQLIVSICVSAILFLLCLKMKPCLVKSYNLWKTGGFLFPVWVCSCALFNYYSDETILALVLLVCGLGVILGGLFVIQAKLYGFKFLKKLKHIKTIIKGKEVVERSGNKS